MMKDAVYWIALAHIPKWGYLKINNLVVKFFHEKKESIESFFEASEKDWEEFYGLSENDVIELKKVKSDLPNLAFLAESLFNQGYEILPITSPEYSGILKKNLKTSHSPTVLYTKGNKKLLEENSIAIVGSRDASTRALDFTDIIAKTACKDFKVVVSGFAKGVDKQALDSAIKYKGQSIIVLPQGIMTFSTGFKNYYKEIIDGNVLVVSTFFPKAPWKVELAMSRNAIIYGLANEIYVAESSEKGGTWSGVVDGLKKGRKIFVRHPDPKEKNANLLLINRGAVSVDFNGKEMKRYEADVQLSSVQEPSPNDSLEIKILSVINDKSVTAKELLLKLGLNWTSQKLNNYLKKLDFIEVVKEKRNNLYKIKGTNERPKSNLLFN